MDARVTLLERLIDHAPLFPPASLPLAAALEEDGRARASGAAFALARFVCPASRVGEVARLDRSLSVVLDGPLERRGRVEAVEVPPGADLAAVAGLAPETYVEVALDGDLEDRLDEIAARGFHAKVRCGGARAPSSEALFRFLAACGARRLAFKATAGLHHAVRTGEEHGLVNLLAAVVLEDVAALEETDAGAFSITPESLRWRDRVASPADISLARRTRLRAVGSCSFFEPVAELRALGLLPEEWASS